MPKIPKIGIITSALDHAAWTLVKKVHEADINCKISFVYVDQNRDESKSGDLMINEVTKLGLRVITPSDLGIDAKFKANHKRIWRDLALAELPKTEFDVLLGYMWYIWAAICFIRTMINLHPAGPGGPAGTYVEVIHQLIDEAAIETGIRMLLVTPVLDGGPDVTYCTFPIISLEFDAIREDGVKREPLIVVETLRILTEGQVRIEGGKMLDSEGRELEGGLDLTREIKGMM